jgi:adenylate cyclase class IV
VIEIEKKFLLTPLQQQALLNDAQLVDERLVKDSYFDTDDYRITVNNLWFRKRNSSYELKVPLKTNSALPAIDKFHELTEIEEICKVLNLNKSADFESELLRNRIKAFMTCSTARKSYSKQGFRIDIDSATYLNSEFIYNIAEIELIVDDESEASRAERRILDFAKSFGLDTSKFILGKVAAYLKKEDTKHYSVLVNSGILQ